jgi:multimeric flavodoxin WrbA
LVVAGPIWLGDNSGVVKQIIQRLSAQSGQLNEQGQHAFYGRVGGALITGNEDGVKHGTVNIRSSLQHLGQTNAPQAECGMGRGHRARPVLPRRGSGWSAGRLHQSQHGLLDLEPDAASNLMHLTGMIERAGGIPASGNQRSAWDRGSGLTSWRPTLGTADPRPFGTAVAAWIGSPP